MPDRVGLRVHRHLRRRLGLSAPFACKPTFVWMLCALAFALHAPAFAQEEPAVEPTDVAGAPQETNAKPTFLVTEIVVGDGVDIPADGARDALAARFGRLRDKLEVRSLSEVKSTLDHDALQALLGSDDDITDVGSYVDVDRLVFGRIFQVGGVTEVSVRVFNVREQSMEMALSRRIGEGKDPSLVLAVVDRLADQLLVWALNTYSDASPSAQFEELKNKKVTMRPKAPPPSPWGTLGVSGGALAGLGAGVATGGAIMMASNPDGDLVVPGVLLGVGGAALVGGATLVVVDGLE